MENISGTVNKAIDILEIFIQKEGEFRLTELAELTGLDKATVYRLTSTLVKRRFLHQAKKNGKYSLGLKMVDCSFAIRRNLKFIDLAYLYLGKLNSAYNTAANLTILDEDKSLVIEEIGISSKGLPMTPPGIKRLPLYASACGKLFLAFMTNDERKAFYERNILKPLTQNTITNVYELEKQLEVVKREGVAFDLEDYKTGQRAIAAPVYDSTGQVVAAVSIIVPSLRFDDRNIAILANAIKSCACELSQAIKQPG
jgi:IclR family transcriptional regulator, KDG regulon repressor